MKMDLLEEKQWKNFGMEQGLFLLPLYHMGIFLHYFVPFKGKCPRRCEDPSRRGL
jgi:hypothetical protein